MDPPLADLKSRSVGPSTRAFFLVLLRMAMTFALQQPT